MQTHLPAARTSAPPAAADQRPSRRGAAVLTVAVLGPALAAALLAPLRDRIAGTDVALVLVLVIVAVAAAGRRAAGLLAALSAGVWYDFFFTRPYEQLAISARADVETTILLFLVGLAVTEIAVWGHRQHAEAGRRAGYEAGIRDAARSMSGDASPGSTVEQVAEQLTAVLGLESCRFDYGAGVLGGRRPRLRADGELEVGGSVWPVDTMGWPTDREIEILVTVSGAYRGRFLMRAGSATAPTLAQRLVAVSLGAHAGEALAKGSG
jgi:Domain of unknown function (DUF4118)